MFEWFLTPIDPSRVHDVGFLVSWHARFMTLAWVNLAPLAVFIARFFKVTPDQDWPMVLDNVFWWKVHKHGQTAVVVLSGIALVLIFMAEKAGSVHGKLGILLLVGLALQVALGLGRGTKGGPTAPAPDGSLRGDHYDMTPRRIFFEVVHKSLGYFLLTLSLGTVILGLWQANAPRWMWFAIVAWWVGLLVASIVAQRRGMAIDTYQAIWGNDPSHPGNKKKPIGFGMRRP